MAAVSHPLADGRAVSFSSDVAALDLSVEPTSTARVVHGNFQYEVVVGKPTLAEIVARHLGFALDEEYRYGSLAIRVGWTLWRDEYTGSRVPMGLASVTGPQASFYFHRYGGRSADLVALVEALAPAEVAGGVRFDLSRRVRPFDVPTMMKELPGLGIATVRPRTSTSTYEARRGVRQVETRTGTASVHGEGAPNETWVVVGDTVVATLEPDRALERAVAHDAIVGLAIELG
jgi:hypothetical protein